MRGILFFIIGVICYQTASATGPVSPHYFQDTARVKKIEPHKNIKPKSSSVPHKENPVVPQKRKTNNRSKKNSIHPQKHIGIDHPSPDQQKLDSIVKAKNKEKSKRK